MQELLIFAGVITLFVVAFFGGLYIEGKKRARGEKVTKDTAAGASWIIVLVGGVIGVLILEVLK
ncbi:MAG: hypothetical protein IV111_07745 [Pseudomonas sp.]|nr:hypothetical protein [Pseudomonas sp.]